MNIKGNLRKFTELGIGLSAVATLILAGCGGGGGGGGGSSSTPSAAALSGLASTFTGTSLGLTDGASSVAQFATPANITSDGTYLYVTDPSGANVRQILISTGAVSTLAGSTIGASGVADGTGTAARFNDPFGITTDGSNLYVTDCANNNIRKIVISTGVVSTFAGSITGASGVTDGSNTSALFNCPMGITKLGTNLYVTDSSNGTVRKIDLNTNTVSTFAGTVGSFGYSTNAAGTNALFFASIGITNDGTNLFVADTGNNNIRQINVATQMVSTLAGSSWINAAAPSLGINPAGSTDGTGTAARFFFPEWLTYDSGNLYVSDTWNHTLRKIVVSTGVVTTLAGTAGASGVVNATGAAARFTYPSGMVYVNGSLYLADFGNSIIRKIQ
ncbi:MAG TPA: hypothetical protein VK149_08410 [Sideroxyarcus sp.]|nr:hypothetical protein [Sideroxyarcus sp.]